MLVFSANLAYSQIGVRAGINIATQTFDDNINQDLSKQIGLNFGITYEYILSKKIRIQPELHFIQKTTILQRQGLDLGTGQATGVDKGYMSLNYIDFSLVSKYIFIDIENGGDFYFGLTPYIGIGLNGKYRYRNPILLGDSHTEKIKFNEKQIRRLDYGIGLGLGANFGILYVDVRFNLGLADLLHTEVIGSADKNRGLLIGVGYKF